MKFVLFGVSTPHAVELVESAGRLGWEIAASVRNVPEPPVPAGVPAVCGIEDLDRGLLALPFAVPQTGAGARRATVDAARACGFSRLLTIVDPTAVVASSASISDGCYLGAGVVVGAGSSLGTGSLVNRSCSLSHHVSLGEYVGSGPGVVVAGECRIGDGAFLGTGAVLAPQVRIGSGAVIGAGAVVIRDVEPGTVVVGNPARPLRHT